MTIHFAKYHGLGNDYIVLDPSEVGCDLSPELMRAICHRNCGVGSDGVLLGPMTTRGSDLALRIFNPDGSEAEKSGNGLRIFARYLWDRGRVTEAPFTVSTLGGDVVCHIHDQGRSVTVEMGKVSFDSTQIPVAGPPHEAMKERIVVDRIELQFCAATIGNPHCVVLDDAPTPEHARHWGPLIEVDPRFPNRTNVQFMKVLDRANIQIEIWERGAGYTLASGSSSCAAAAVARRISLCDSHIAVHMPGGKLDVTVSDDFSISMTGPVAKIAEGELAEELLAAI